MNNNESFAIIEAKKEAEAKRAKAWKEAKEAEAKYIESCEGMEGSEALSLATFKAWEEVKKAEAEAEELKEKAYSALLEEAKAEAKAYREAKAKEAEAKAKAEAEAKARPKVIVAKPKKYNHIDYAEAMKPKTEAKAKAERKEDFERLIDTFLAEANGENTLALAKAIACSVTKKIYSASGADIMRRLHDDVVHEEGDGEDLISEASKVLLEEKAEAEAEGRNFKEAYKVIRLNRRVYLYGDTDIEWKTEELTPVQIAYKAVRRWIEAQGSVKYNPRSGHLYLQDLVKYEGEEEGKPEAIEEAIYIRMPKHYDFTMEEEEAEDSEGLRLMVSEAMDTIEALTEALGLTDRQASILRYRLKGFGKKAIASALKVDKTTIRNHLRTIGKKYEEAISKAKAEEAKAKEETEEEAEAKAKAEAEAKAKKAKKAEAKAKAKAEEVKHVKGKGKAILWIA